MTQAVQEDLFVRHSKKDLLKNWMRRTKLMTLSPGAYKTFTTAQRRLKAIWQAKGLSVDLTTPKRPCADLTVKTKYMNVTNIREDKWPEKE